MDAKVEQMLDKWKKNYEALALKDLEAKKQGNLVGRFIREPIADGYAYYLITKENKKTVIIEHVTGLGDDYFVSYWGSGAKIDKDYAIQSVEGRDALRKIFGGKK